MAAQKILKSLFGPIATDQTGLPLPATHNELFLSEPMTIAAQALLAANIEAYNRHDIEAFAATYGADAELLELGTGTLLAKGFDAVKAYYGARFKANPSLHAEVIQRIVQGDTYIDQERLSGALNASGDAERPPFTAVVISELKHGKIHRVWLLR